MNWTKKAMYLVLILLLPNILFAQTTVTSLADLLPYLDDDNVEVTLAPGTYSISASDVSAGTFSNPILLFSGSNSTYDFTDVTIKFNTNLFTAFGNVAVDEIQITGNNSVLKNLTMVDDGSVDDRPSKTALGIKMDGMNNLIEGFHMTVKGSYPYGYGDSFGKGAGSVIGHNKHSAVLIRGTSNHFKNTTIIQQSYGHMVFMQGAVDPLIEGCYLEAEVRSTDDMLAETSGPAYDVDFMTVWGYKLPAGYVKGLCEAGVRAYASGVTIIDGEEIDRKTYNPTVRNCTIKRVRSAVTLSQASGTETIEGCTAIECERGFALATGTVTNCSADVKYGAALSCDSNDGITGDITIIPYEGESYNGSKTAVFLSGRNHTLTINSTVPNPDQSLKIKLSGDFTSVGNLGQVDVLSASGVTMNNLSNYPLVLSSESSNCTGVSGGMVTDFGTNNTFNHSAVSVFKIEAEDYTSMDGVSSETTSDVGAGENVTAIDAGDWIEYELDIPFTGTYSMDYRVASESLDGDFTLSVDGSTLEQISFSATTGAQTWATHSSAAAFYLTEGTQTIRITANTDDWNINYMDLLLECAVVPIIPYVEEFNALRESQGREQATNISLPTGNTAVIAPEPAIGGTWNWTGPNGFTANTRTLTFLDIDESKSGTYLVTLTNDCGLESTETFTISIKDFILIEAEDYTSMNGVSLEVTTDIDGGSNVSAIDVNDWMEYVINVPYSANYSIDYRVASESASGDFTVSMDGSQIERITFDATGGAQTWTTVSSEPVIYLEAGEQKLRIASNVAGWKMNWIILNSIELIRPCELPLSVAGFDIKNTTLDWSSGSIDISCGSDLSIFFTIEGIGDLEETDYLNIYYKLDDGQLVTISENLGALDLGVVSIGEIDGDKLELIVQSHSGSVDNYYTISNISVLHYSDPFARLEVEESDESLSLRTENTSDVGGGKNVGWTSGGDWFTFYNIDLTEVKSFNARVSGVSASALEVRLDDYAGTLLGTISVPNTGGYQDWKTASTDIDDVVGIHDVCFVMQGSFNINWFQAVGYNNDASISSTKYTIDESAKTITNVPVDERFSFFKYYLTPADGASFEVYLTDGITLATEVASGNKVIVTAEDGSTQQTYTVGLASSIDANLNAHIEIYPNPATDHINVVNSNGAKLEVYSNLGVLLLNSDIASDQQSVDIRALESGLYFMIIYNVDGSSNRYRIIKH